MTGKTTKTTATPKDAKLSQNPISGKLGIIAKAIAAPKGATLEELKKKTDWQPHTIRAALTRLRPRGIDARPTTIEGRTAFRAAKVEI